MPADLRKMVNNLTAFFDFTGKTVLHAGAGAARLLITRRLQVKFMRLIQTLPLWKT